MNVERVTCVSCGVSLPKAVAIFLNEYGRRIILPRCIPCYEDLIRRAVREESGFSPPAIQKGSWCNHWD